MLAKKALPKAPKLNQNGNVSKKTLNNDSQCAIVNNLIGILRCETQPIFPQLCSVLLDFRAKNCGGAPPTDPCAGVTCSTDQHCENGICVPNCKPTGDECSLNEECCSSVCDMNRCL